MLKIFLYTIYIALSSTIIAAVIGIVTAYFTSHYKFAGRKLILSLSTIPLCVPPLIMALGYVGFFGMNGVVNNFIKSLFKLDESPITFLYSSFGVILVQGFYNFPLVTGIVNEAWQSLPKETENAAKLLGADNKRIFFTITWKNLRGSVAAACMPLFLYCFFSFMIVLLFSPPGFSTLEVELYHTAKTVLDLPYGIKIVILETVTAFCITLIYSFIIRKNDFYNSGTTYINSELQKIKGIKSFAFGSLMLLIILFFFCPFVCIFINGIKSQEFNFYKPFFTTLAVGVVTGLFCIIISFFYAVMIKINKKQKSFLLQTVPLLPLAISSVAISWIACLIFKKGNICVLILLQCILYWPVAYKQIQNGMNKISFETDSAAQIFSKNKFDSIIRIYLPACKKYIITGFTYCFAMSAGDATLPLMLSIKNFNSLSLNVYKLASSYKFNQACSCSIILILVCSILFSVCKNINFENQ